MKDMRKQLSYLICLMVSFTDQMLPGAEPSVSGFLPVEDMHLLGMHSGDNFGASLSGGGDFNGDGHADWVVGAPYADPGYNSAGAAYLFLGGSFLSKSPVAVFAGEAADDQAGVSVASDFDLNNDGFDDVAVGVRFTARGASDGGAVFVYLGRAESATAPSPDLYLLAEAADDWFGHSVSSAGDVNNDGFDDLVIGAPYNDAVANAAGRAYVIFGASDPAAVSQAFIDGAAESNAHFGWSVSGGGDVNQDGYDDIIVGARLHGTGPSRASGRAYVFLGGNPFTSSADLILEGEARDDWFGEAVAIITDVNSDGFDELMVGAIYRDPGGLSAAGEASLFLGGNPPDLIRDLRIAGPEPDAQASNALASVGDFNGDQHGDFIVGAHFADNGTILNTGSAMLFLGGITPENATDLIISGTNADDHVGKSLTRVGDPVYGMGTAFAVGIHYDDTGGLGAGRASLFRAATPELGLSIRPVQNGMQLEVETLNGFLYQFQQSETMDHGSWLDLGLPASGDGSNATVTDSNFDGLRFYRVKIFSE